MADVVDASTRSRMMSGISGKNTRQEIEIRKRLFALGFRYKLHDKKLPGKPDIVFPKYKAAIFVHGCFWHAHDCHLFHLPATRKAFWKAKLEGTKARDIKHLSALKKLGWRVLIIWECTYRGAGKDYECEIYRVIDKTAKWLTSQSKYSEITA